MIYQLVNKRIEIIAIASFHIASSVARGELELPPPNCPEKYAKYHVFSAFEADFCSKNGNNPPNRIGDQKLWRTRCDLDHRFFISLT